MSKQLYTKNIKALGDHLGIFFSPELDPSCQVTIVINHSPAVILTINYDFEEGCMELKTQVSSRLPQSRVGIQSIMNKLVGELLMQRKLPGRLVANLDENAIFFTQKVEFKGDSEKVLSENIDTFIQESNSWRQKFKAASPSGSFSDHRKEREILYFKAI